MEKAFKSLGTAVFKNNLSDLERAALIKTYELTFELAWKILKDYLNYKSVQVKYPRDTIKEAFKHNLIDDRELWLGMLYNII